MGVQDSLGIRSFFLPVIRSALVKECLWDHGQMLVRNRCVVAAYIFCPSALSLERLHQRSAQDLTKHRIVKGDIIKIININETSSIRFAQIFMVSSCLH